MLTINRKDERPIWQQLLDQAIHNITTGNWAPGELLLPTRELAQLLGVSRSTIQTVYEELYSRGYTVTSRRGGTRVSQWTHKLHSTEEVPDQGPALPDLSQLHSATSHLQNWFGHKDPHKLKIDFTPHEPYLDEAFLSNWRQSFLQASTDSPLSSWAYGDPYGYLPLREQIQRYLSLERGIHVSVDQILLTSGAQHSLDLIAQALLTTGSTVSVEDPGFPAAWMAMKYQRMQVEAVPVDEHGLEVDHISPDSKLVYVTPSHQCAVGVIMSEPRRQQLLHLAAEQGIWIVEDDYDSEFRYRGDPLPTLYSQRPQNTLYMLSFSKMIAPGIRMSAIVAPKEAIAQLARVHELIYRQLPIMEQLTLTHFMKQGHFMRHMRKVRNIYRRRHAALTKAIISSGLSERFSLKGAETGLHMLLEAEPSFHEKNVTQLALEQGIRIYPLSQYGLKSQRKGWILGFAKVDEDAIEQGIKRLADIVLQ